VKVDLSIVIPAYNEERRLPPTIEKVLEWADDSAVFNIELIIVDDGSQDGTRAMVRTFAERDARVRLIEETHVGAMHAIMSGFRAARYELVGNMDADCAVHPREYERLLPFVSATGIAQGSRVLRDGLPPVENKSLPRRLLSFFMYRLFIGLFPIGVHDPQIGFRLFNRSAVLRIIPLMRLPHDGIKHAEVVVRGFGLGMAITEIPVPYIHDEDSRCVPKSPVKMATTALAAAWAVLTMWGQVAVDYHRGILSRCPVRLAAIFRPFAGCRGTGPERDGV
jgi:dolichyl-phosphate beta-glucosyltransferase